MVHEAGETARSLIGVMKDQPMVLAVIVLNIVIFAAIVFAVRDQRTHEHQVMQLILEKCLTK